ncbi:unnamed protein product [Closterium sp. NIES-54]
MMEKFFSFMSFYEQHQQGAPAQSNNSNNNNATPMTLVGSSYARGNQQQPTFAPYELGGVGGGGGGSGGSGGSGSGGSGGGRTRAQRGGSRGGQRRQKQHRSETPSPQQLREWLFSHGASGGSVSCPYVIPTGDRAGQTCGKSHTQHRCFSRLENAWRAELGDEVERPYWAELLRSGVATFDIDYDAILSAMYDLSASAEGDCYRCVLPDLDIEAAALGASESSLPGTAPAEALHTFTLNSGASRCFFRETTTLTPLHSPVPVRLADPPGGPDVARSSTVLPCPAIPSGSLSGLHLPLFSTNTVITAALQDAMVTTTTPGGQRVSTCTCTRTGRHLATFTRRPRSSLYTLATEPPQVVASTQVSALGQIAPPCSCRLLLHQNLLWHHRLGHPSLPRLRGMHSRLLVFGLPRSLPPPPPSPAAPCLPCVKGRQRAAPHSSSIPLTTAPLQTLHIDVWGPARVSRQGRERYLPAVGLQLRERFRADLRVLRLHSDRGGEFSSDLLRDFCRGEGILQSFTLPDSPQQNGIAERRIGLVMEVARTSMIHAAAPHFLWSFAVRYAAHQLNLWSRVSLPKTSPTLRWMGKVGDASVFRVWGSRIFVHNTSVDKLSVRAILCVFLGFSPDAPGWQFYHPTSRRVFPSQDVTFEESVPFYHFFPYRSAPPPPPPLFLARGPAPVLRLEVLHLGGAEPGGAESEGAGSGDVEPRGEESGGAEPGGAELEGAESGGAEPRGAALSGGTGDAGGGGAGVTAGAGGTGGIEVAGPGGARTRGTGAALSGGVGGAGAGDPTEPGVAGAVGAGAGGTGARGAGAGGATVGCTGAGRTRVGGAGAVDPGGTSGGLTERREHASRHVSPVRTARRVPCSRPPPIPGMHAMALRPSSVPQRVPLPPPPESSLPEVLDLESNHARVASPTVSRLLTTAVTNPSFDFAAASALVAELLDFAVACRLDHATVLVAESKSVSPPSVRGEYALGMDVLEDKQEDFECLSAAVPRFASMLLAPEGDPDAPDIPTPHSNGEAITGPYSSQWQAAMDAEMASWKSTGTYVDKVPSPGANIVDGMWIFRVKRLPGSPPAFKARYVARGFSMGLVLGGRVPVVLTDHADASWVDDSATQRSSEGYTFSLGSGSVSWRSTCSSSVLSSSCETEIYAGAMAAQELRWLTYLLTDLGEQPRSPPVLFVDNKAMVALCQEHRTKHIALRYFLARELQQRGQLRFANVATRANIADIFTKALPPGDHQRFSTVLGLVPTLPHLLTA